MRGLIFICCVALLPGCTVDRAGTRRGSGRRFDSGSAPDAGVGVDAASAPDGGAGVDAGSASDAGSPPGDAGGPGDAGCAGDPGDETCPLTTLGGAYGLSQGLHHFSFGGHLFQTWTTGRTTGWVLVASERGDGVGPVAMGETTTGPLGPGAHLILAEALVTGMPDVGEVMINSSPGSDVVASVRSRDPHVLSQFRMSRSLMTRGDEAGSVRWRGARGHVARMKRAVGGAAIDALPNLIYSANENPTGLHWAPLNPAPMWHSWTEGEGRGDRLNLWVRAVR